MEYKRPHEDALKIAGTAGRQINSVRFDQLDQARALGCQLAQGLLFGKTQPPVDWEALPSRPVLDLPTASCAPNPDWIGAFLSNQDLSEALS